MALQVLTALFRCPLRAGCFVLCGTFYLFPSTDTFDGVLGEHRQGAYAGAGRAPGCRVGRGADIKTELQGGAGASETEKRRRPRAGERGRDEAVHTEQVKSLGLKGHVTDGASERDADSLLPYLGASSLRARDLRSGECWTPRIHNCQERCKK